MVISIAVVRKNNRVYTIAQKWRSRIESLIFTQVSYNDESDKSVLDLQ